MRLYNLPTGYCFTFATYDGHPMSWAKRKLAAKRSRTHLGMLDKFSTVSPDECIKAEYLMRYGKDWVKHWSHDHPSEYSTDWNPTQMALPRPIIHADMDTVLTISEVTLYTKHVTCALGVGSLEDGTSVTVGCLGSLAEHLVVGKQRVLGDLHGGKRLHFSVKEISTAKPEEPIHAQRPAI